MKDRRRVSNVIRSETKFIYREYEENDGKIGGFEGTPRRRSKRAISFESVEETINFGKEDRCSPSGSNRDVSAFSEKRFRQCTRSSERKGRTVARR